MPLYEVTHSYPLTAEQRQHLAGEITRLHATAFTTPSLFVNVIFKQENPNGGTFFIAGKQRASNTNRISGHVRTSPQRTKADFDALAASIEEAWYATVKSNDADGAATAGKKLHGIFFIPLITVRENGIPVPDAGKEAEWFREQMPAFKKAVESGDTDVADMLRELQERSDLAVLRS